MDNESLRRIGGGSPDISDIAPPEGRRFWVTEEMVKNTIHRNGEIKPTFSISELTKVFFARSGDWMRYLLSQTDDDSFVLDGKKFTPRRTDKGSRYYTLADVERLCHALLQMGHIDITRFYLAIQVVRWMACMYGMVPMADMNADYDPTHPYVVRGQLALLSDEEIDTINQTSQT